MSKSLLVKCGLPLLAGVIVLAGCGSRGPASSSGGSASSSSAATTLAIGFDAPLTGDESAVGPYNSSVAEALESTFDAASLVDADTTDTVGHTGTSAAARPHDHEGFVVLSRH